MAPLRDLLAVRAVNVVGIDEVNPVFVHGMHRLPEIPVVRCVGILGQAIRIDGLRGPGRQAHRTQRTRVRGVIAAHTPPRHENRDGIVDTQIPFMHVTTKTETRRRLATQSIDEPPDGGVRVSPEESCLGARNYLMGYLPLPGLLHISKEIDSCRVRYTVRKPRCPFLSPIPKHTIPSRAMKWMPMPDHFSRLKHRKIPPVDSSTASSIAQGTHSLRRTLCHAVAHSSQCAARCSTKNSADDSSNFAASLGGYHLRC